MSDFDPGTVTTASSGPEACGARQVPVLVDPDEGWEYRWAVIGFYHNEPTRGAG
ncbi:hypothetical protein GCM10022240_20410 [Microbacterium kribbense]|uniref:Uncharacterized protein n=1 Tax=Microbacterium kribbense TaxID=433645 RepID=A0ABP7GL69_9MICO